MTLGQRKPGGERIISMSLSRSSFRFPFFIFLSFFLRSVEEPQRSSSREHWYWFLEPRDQFFLQIICSIGKRIRASRRVQTKHGSQHPASVLRMTASSTRVRPVRCFPLRRLSVLGAPSYPTRVTKPRRAPRSPTQPALADASASYPPFARDLGPMPCRRESCIILPHCIWVSACYFSFFSFVSKQTHTPENIYVYDFWQLG